MTDPCLATTTPDGRRVYKHPVTGEEVPAVSTVIGMIAKPNLIGWAAKMGADYAVANWDYLTLSTDAEKISGIKNAHREYADSRGVIGDTVHEAIDAFQKGEPATWDKQTGSYVTQFINFMMDVQPVFLETEVTVWSRKYGYAGTADWIADIGGDIILGDNKTGKRLYPEVGLQLAALAHADFIIRPDGSEELLPPARALKALHIRPRSWHLVEIQHEDRCFQAFLAARKLLEWDQLYAAGVLA
jgi:hypothetical protein